MTSSSPRSAIDYPHLDDALWILWSGKGKWPDADRQISYLTAHRSHVMKGFALYSTDWQDAATFPAEAEARTWLAENEAKRPHAYGVNVTTVADMKIACGYALK